MRFTSYDKDNNNNNNKGTELHDSINLTYLISKFRSEKTSYTSIAKYSLQSAYI